MSNEEMTAVKERLRRHEGLLFTNMALAGIVLVLMLAVLAFQVQPELRAGIAQTLSPSTLAAKIDETFSPPLAKVFGPIDAFLAKGFWFWARFVTLGFFFGTWVWVFVGLKREYVNLEAPSRKFYCDLRFWTVASMLPHVIVYFFF